MAFDTADLVLLAHGNDKKLFYHDANNSSDSLATVVASGYYNNNDDDIRMVAGDLIFVKASDATAMLEVTSVSSGSVSTQIADQSAVAAHESASTSANLSAVGISQLEATGGATYTLDAPFAGAIKYLIRTSTSGSAINVDTATTSITYEGTNDRAVFTNAEDALVLVGLSATRWGVVSNEGTVTFS